MTASFHILSDSLSNYLPLLDAIQSDLLNGSLVKPQIENLEDIQCWEIVRECVRMKSVWSMEVNKYRLLAGLSCHVFMRDTNVVSRSSSPRQFLS